MRVLPVSAFRVSKTLSSDEHLSIFSDIFAQMESRFNVDHSETGIHDPSARVAAISALDKGIDATREIMRQFLLPLFTRRNALVPISLLPPEILARVFHFLARVVPPLPSSGHKIWAGSKSRTCAAGGVGSLSTIRRCGLKSGASPGRRTQCGSRRFWPGRWTPRWTSSSTLLHGRVE